MIMCSLHRRETHGNGSFCRIRQVPGAVRCGLAYLRNDYESPSEYGRVIERVVLFTSAGVADVTEEAFKSVHNEYMDFTAKH